MKRKLLYVLGLVCLIYATALVALYFNQRTLLYFPTPEVQIKGFDTLDISSGEQTLKVWAAQRGSFADAIIYFGGNAESLVYTAALLNNLFPDKNLYLPNYRGYGGSNGRPSEAAFEQDALAVYDWVAQRNGHVAVIGRSLGSGVATYLASQRKVQRLALVTPYDSMKSVAAESLPMFPVSWLLKDQYDSLARAKSIHAPTLLITAQDDEVITAKHSDRLLAALKHVGARKLEVKNANHNDIARTREYAMALLVFLGDDRGEPRLREQ